MFHSKEQLVKDKCAGMRVDQDNEVAASAQAMNDMSLFTIALCSVLHPADYDTQVGIWNPLARIQNGGVI